MNGKGESMLSLKLYEDIQNYVDEHYLLQNCRVIWRNFSSGIRHRWKKPRN